MTDPSSKLSPQALRLLAASQDRAEDQSVDVLIRIDDHAGRGWREQLEAAGASLRTVAGDVCTASVALSALHHLAELHEVRAIEVTTPLYGEAPPTE